MSGGSWEYVYHRFDDVAERLKSEPDPLRQAFGEHVALVAEAMRAIEWVDSGDSSPPQDADAIRRVLGERADQAELAASVRSMKELTHNLKALVQRLEVKGGEA